MKTNFLGTLAMIAAIFATTACQKDKTDDTWKQLPVGQITVESGDAAISVNEVPSAYGNAQLVASGETDAELTLTGAVPGFTEVKMNVELQKKDEGTFHFSGSQVLSTPPSIAATLRSYMSNGFYTVEVQGDVTVEGKISVGVETKVSSGTAESLMGSWNIVRKCKYGETGPVNGPAQITWKAEGDAGAGIVTITALANAMICPLLTEVFNQVTFDGTGNIMAQYYSDLDLGDEPISKIFELAFGVTPDEDGNVTYTAHHTDWVSSPKANLAFWYTQDASLFIVPNVAAIIRAGETEDVKSDASGIDLSTITELLAKLGELGADVNSLNAELQKMLSRGIELKYSVADGNLKIYVDKSLCAPVVESLLPVLPVLDTLLEELAKSEDPKDQETLQMIQMVMGMLQIEKPSDLAAVWKNTSEFEIALNFTKA